MVSAFRDFGHFNTVLIEALCVAKCRKYHTPDRIYIMTSTTTAGWRLPGDIYFS